MKNGLTYIVDALAGTACLVVIALGLIGLGFRMNRWKP